MLDKLKRSTNLRDLGGVLASDGRRVRRGRIFRSGALTDLAADELAAVQALDIHTIVDLRRNAERSACPTPWQTIGCKNYWSRDYEESDADHRERMQQPDYTAKESRDWMLALFSELPYEHAASYAFLFRAIATGAGPILFHCAVGKDRTGAAAALVLEVAGVGRGDILADYNATGDYDLLGSPHIRGVTMRGDRAQAFAPLLGTDPAYLDVMFETIKCRNGSVENYLGEELGLDPSERSSIRDQLLEAA